MSNEARRDRRNYLRNAIKAAEKERAEHMARFPAYASGNHDFGKHIGRVRLEYHDRGGDPLP